jgi:DNA-binding response OmpR family regulator
VWSSCAAAIEDLAIAEGLDPLGKILVVDDAPFIRLLLKETLEELADEGHAILEADNGEAAWHLIRHARPELVLLDVMMPKMSGYEVCQQIKNDPDLAGTYVILLTAKGQEADRVRGREVGADEYITKPFDPDDIVQRARSALGSRIG